MFYLVASASDFQRLHNAISTNLTKITNNGMFNRLISVFFFYDVFLIATDLEKLVQKLGTPEDSEPLRER